MFDSWHNSDMPDLSLQFSIKEKKTTVSIPKVGATLPSGCSVLQNDYQSLSLGGVSNTQKASVPYLPKTKVQATIALTI